MEEESLASGWMRDVQGFCMQRLPFYAESLFVSVCQRVIDKLEEEGLVYAIEFIAYNGITQ